MKFRQKEIMFIETQVFILFCLITNLILIVYNHLLISVLLIPAMLLLLVFVSQLIIKQKIVTIDKNGISCQKGKELCWKYEWPQIAELRIGRRFRNPSVEIVLKGSFDNKDEYVLTGDYFQLGPSAKKAIKVYEKSIKQENTGDGKNQSGDDSMIDS